MIKVKIRESTLTPQVLTNLEVWLILTTEAFELTASIKTYALTM